MFDFGIGKFFQKFFGQKGFKKIQTEDAITIIIPGRRLFTMPTDHDLFPELNEAMKEKNDERVLDLIASAEKITVLTNGDVTVKNGQVYYKDELQGNIVARKITQFAAAGIDPQFLIKFLERVKANPAKYAQDELYLFLENGNLAILDDGRFVAYKWVRENYTDTHSGRFENKPGMIIQMEREKVDPDRHNTCSYGFHVCTQYYSKFGQKLMLVAIDPADVVAVPSDYKNAKMRVCKYEVLSEIDGENYGGMKEKAFLQYKDVATLSDADRAKFGQADPSVLAAYKPKLAETNVTMSDRPVEERFDLWIIAVRNSISTIKLLREEFDGLGLKEAADMVRGPIIEAILKSVTKEQAEDLAKKLAEIGTSTTCVAHGTKVDIKVIEYKELKEKKVPSKTKKKKVAKKTKTPKKAEKAKKKEAKKKMQTQTTTQPKAAVVKTPAVPILTADQWASFKKDVKNKRNATVMAKKYGVSGTDLDNLRTKARAEINNG